MSHLLTVAQERLARATQIPVALQLDSKGARTGPDRPAVTIGFADESYLMLLANNALDEVAAAYVAGRVRVVGTLRDLMKVTADLVAHAGTSTSMPLWRRMVGSFVSAIHHTRNRDLAQIGFHYDVSDAFYQLWLDPRRVYSCAYYRSDNASLAEAQEAKLDHICRKLDLRSGESFLDVGAGWGGLLLWAAENYGVKATGITLSRNQYAHVTRLIEEKGLTGRVEMKLIDYRDLDAAQPFDKIASVGMFEHVGRANLPVYFEKLYSLLKPGGLLMNHGITSSFTDEKPLAGGIGNFIERFVFPGGELLHVSHVLRDLADAGLEMVDTENLRPHYARTLWAWSDSLEGQLDAALDVLRREKGEEEAQRILRVYRLYLSGCAMAFEQNWVALHQILATKPDGKIETGPMTGAQSSYPFRRDYIYRSGE